VVAEEDGQLALNTAKESDFDLVVTDIFMPNLDGYGLTSGLREIGFTGAIVGVSAATIGEERDRLIEAGASAALAKPISVEKLTEALQSIDQPI
jgi:CheY-like chemotaxis protein